MARDHDTALQNLVIAESKVLVSLKALSNDIEGAAAALKAWADQERGRLGEVSQASTSLLRLYADALQQHASQGDKARLELASITAHADPNPSKESAVKNWLTSKFESLLQCSEKAAIAGDFGHRITSSTAGGPPLEALVDEARQQMTRVGNSEPREQSRPNEPSPSQSPLSRPDTVSRLSPTLPPWLFKRSNAQSRVQSRTSLPPRLFARPEVQTHAPLPPLVIPSPRPSFATPLRSGESVADATVGEAWSVERETPSPPTQALPTSSDPVIHGTVVGSTITGGNNVNIATAGRDVRIYNGITSVATEELNFLEWVSSIDSKAVQSSILDKVTPDTGRWFLESTRCQEWMDSEKMRLWGAGKPGAGKTFLSSIIINVLEEMAKSDTTITVVYVYCRYAEHFTTIQVFATLLRQLAENSKVVFDATKEKLYTSTLRRGRARTPTLTQILNAILEALGQFSKAYIILDALDELDIPVRHEVVGILERRFETPVLLTSRLTDLPDGLSPDFEIRPPSEDIHAFVRHELNKPGRLQMMLSRRSDSESILSEVAKKVEAASEGLFLAAALHLPDLKDAPTVQALKRVADQLPQGGIDRMYETFHERVRDQPEEVKRLAYRTIGWILYAVRPLRMKELVEVLAVEPGCQDVDWEDGLMEEKIVIINCCGMLELDEATDTIRFVHITARDYFEQKTDILEDVFYPSPHRFMADVCTSYVRLVLAGQRLPQETLKTRFATRAFLDHACRYVGSYIRLTMGSTQDQNIPETVHDQVLRYIPQALLQLPSIPLLTDASTIDQGGLAHLAALSGLTVLLKWAVASFPGVSKVNEQSEEGMTPLFYAVIGDHIPSLQFLLSMEGIDVNHKARNEQTALMTAANFNRVEARQILLDDHRSRLA